MLITLVSKDSTHPCTFTCVFTIFITAAIKNIFSCNFFVRWIFSWQFNRTNGTTQVDNIILYRVVDVVDVVCDIKWCDIKWCDIHHDIVHTTGFSTFSTT